MGIRIINYGAGVGNATGKSYVTDAFAHEPIGADFAVLEELAHIDTLPPAQDDMKDLFMVVAARMAVDMVPMLDREYIHATNPQEHVYHRRQDDGPHPYPQCTQCTAHMFGSWFCRSCGSDLCLKCYKLVDIENIPGMAKPGTVWACSPSNMEMWNTHNPRHFSPIARVPVHHWSVLRSVAVHAAAKFKNTAKDSVARIATTLRAQTHSPSGTVDSSTRIRGRPELKSGTSTVPTLVVGINPEDGIKGHQRVLQTILLMKDAVIIQQGFVKPLDRHGLKALLPEETPVPARTVRQKREKLEDLAWTKVADVLTRSSGSGKSKASTWIDVRDFPEHADLATLNEKLVREFRLAGSFPDRQTGKLSQENLAGVLGDMAAWAEMPGRDAKEKCYGETCCTDFQTGTYCVRIKRMPISSRVARRQASWLLFLPGIEIVKKIWGDDGGPEDVDSSDPPFAIPAVCGEGDPEDVESSDPAATMAADMVAALGLEGLACIRVSCPYPSRATQGFGKITKRTHAGCLRRFWVEKIGSKSAG
ncbi:hypothetical protein CF327_g2500 [Tilletia walkeri]|nr:hypothetical protein CF327_g2500 [Tilletia walkeri]